MILSVLKVQAQQDAASICSHSKIKLYKNFQNQDRQKYSSEPYFGYDLKFHRLKFEINPDEFYIKGAITSYFEVESDNFDQIKFDMNDALSVDSVLYHNEHLNFGHSENELQITLPAIIPSGDLDSLIVYYQGEPESSGFGAFMQDEHSGHNIIWTLSEPYGAMDWWPCKQSLDDKIDSIDVIVSMPVGNKAASNGLLISETVEDNIKTDIWEHRHPITTYLIAIAVTNYEAYSDYAVLSDQSQVEILNYVYPESLITAQQQTPDLIDVMQFFSMRFVDYPFKNEKYGHAQFSWGGGMEHQTMSFMKRYSHGLMAHELAHQWFGDYITCGSWKDIWLNEGFATYLEGLTVEQGLDNGKYEDFTKWKSIKIELIISEPGGSVYVDDTTSVSRIFNRRLTYYKGAMVLHMLRKSVGDEIFFSSLRNYLNDPEVANGYATTEDLSKHFRPVCGMSMDYFFEDWIYGQGFPTYDIDFSYTTSQSGVIKISQTQSHESVEFFELPVPILFSGLETDSLLFFYNTQNNEEFTVDVDFNIEQVSFDPNSDLVALGEINFIKDSLTNSLVNVYPNPVNENINVFVPNGYGITGIDFYNTEGKLIEQFNYKESIPQNVVINISDFSKGRYILKILIGSEYVIKKLIIE